MDTRNQMSWPTWSAAAPPIPTAAIPTNPIQSTILPTSVNSAPSVLPPGLQYSPEQWAQAQQHNWQQWAQWQQQYQQWHQQYGAEYQKSLAMQSTVPAATQPPLPTLINTAVIPPLPENKPPLPPDEPPENQVTAMSSYTSTKPLRTGYTTMTMTQPPPTTQLSWQHKRPYGQENEYYQNKTQILEQAGSQQEIPAVQATYSQPPPQTPAKVNVEELSEAEKKFDKEFAAWEAQFQKWKEQNANHPDKTQYREYEKKWESWRNSLLERREQMRRKRLALSSSSTTAQQSTAAIKEPNFTQPPPNINQQAVNIQQNAIPTAYTSLPPNQNNEPLSFKSNTDQSVTEENFLGTPSLTSAIPGLDLIKDDCKDSDKDDKELLIKGPDLDAISKGITSILGDQKLLNMLSLVTKHPPPAPVQQKSDFVAQTPVSNFQENQLGNLSLPPPTTAYRDNFNEQSNQSVEDRSNQGDYHQREAVTNFDDQTRSSFTMGPGDPDHGYRHRGQSGRFGDERVGSSFGSGVQRNNVPESSAPRSLLSLTFPPGGPKLIDDNYGPSGSMNSDNFASGGSRHKLGSARNDSFRQIGAENAKRFSQNNLYRNEGFTSDNRRNNFGKNERFGNNYDNNDDHYADHPDNMSAGRDRSGNYNQDDDYENYNENEDYDKYHDIFNENEHDYREDNEYGYNNLQKDSKIKQAPSDFVISNQSVPSQEPFLPEPKASVRSHNQEVCPEDTIFEPAKVIDYEHKSLRQADFDVTIEPIHMFDYRHRPLNRIPVPQRPKWLSESVKFIREFDPLAPRIYERNQREKMAKYPDDRLHSYERDRSVHDRGRREINRSRGKNERDNGSREKEYSEHKTGPDEYTEYWEGNEKKHRFRNQSDTSTDRGNKRLRLEDVGKTEHNDDVDGKDIEEEKFNLRDDLEELSDEDMDWEEGERTKLNISSDEPRNKSRSSSPILSNPPNPSNLSHEIQVIEDIINPPGRFTRPPRIVIILRGPPGSGKTYLARLIKDKEIENGGSAPRILSLDDYFMIEQERNVVEDGKQITVKEMVYEYEAEMEESYRASFVKSFKKTITDGYFPFIIVDNVNDKVKYFGEMWSFAKQNGFQVYVCQMDLDPVLCTKRCIHNRTETEIEECIAGWEPTPNHHPTVDVTNFLQSNQIKEVEMEVADEKIPQEEKGVDETRELNLTESVSRSERRRPSKNTSSWSSSGRPSVHENRDRRGFAGPTWRNKGNWRR